MVMYRFIMSMFQSHGILPDGTVSLFTPFSLWLHPIPEEIMIDVVGQFVPLHPAQLIPSAVWGVCFIVAYCCWLHPLNIGHPKPAKQLLGLLSFWGCSRM